MKRIDNDAFYEFIKHYDQDSEYHLVGEVDYHLLSDDKPYEGMQSHREALRVVFEWLVEKSIEDKERARIMFGDDLAKQLRLWFMTSIRRSLLQWTIRCFSTARVL